MKQLFYLLSLIFILSCDSTKKVTINSNNNKNTVDELIKSLNKPHTPKTIKMNALVHFKNKNINKKVSVNIRILTDSIIWVNASILGFSVAKLKVTPYTFELLNRFEKHYVYGNINSISKIIGVKISFKNLQNILLGNLVQKLSPKKVNIKDTTITENENHIRKRIRISQSLEYIISQHLQENKTKRQVLLKYKNIKKIDDFSIPKIITLQVFDKENIYLKLQYKNIELNQLLEFPFKISKKYTREEL